MSRTAHVCLVLLLFRMLLSPVVADDRPQPGTQQAESLDRQLRVRLDYLLYLPKEYDRQDSWPLLLFLHGAGERGDDLELVKRHGPPKLIAGGREMPFIVVSPQCPSDRWWQPVELAALLDEIQERHKVDADRIYVTGLSMGGFGTWALAFYRPDRFAALAPICGGGDPIWAGRISHVPARVFHGDEDPAVPVRRSEEMVAALKAEGADVEITVYPGVAHDSWTQTYDDPKLYEWLVGQKRTEREPTEQ